MPEDAYDINPTRMTETVSKAMPQDPEAESSVLSAMMISQEALQECLIDLSAEDFYLPSNAKVYRAMHEMFDKNLPIDKDIGADFLIMIACSYIGTRKRSAASS